KDHPTPFSYLISGPALLTSIVKLCIQPPTASQSTFPEKQLLTAVAGLYHIVVDDLAGAALNHP
ncbi:MAG: hypothetical protein V2I33_21695, partial [Kangiellaceae bacterium]|nr:hypothetical protein [Kangiellaceae bacterium]